MSTELNWFKSSYSGSQSGDCVEVAHSTSSVHVRDSKNVDTHALELSPTAWTLFVAYASE
ncbi:DUF397 domain-containing protein [Streptomyces sp. NBC_00102]|uniref:DUF397 domain-containing protein n=1 Tax=Streptomyces sp. NBC_00102 TaxID=2975652 RepID=UPI00225B6EEF|nr:DUF397 domain-containing protein [Streptomyces sp. NBC_00102]MCX5397755.1 DUF397 domain-containing protein [Streptomyces sp. NBC_00102]